MSARWRVRPPGLAIVVLATAVLTGAVGCSPVAQSSPPERSLVVRLADGTEAARLALPDDGRFALRYRNSLYGSVAEERFVVDGARATLVELAADELAVLEEYYAADTATSADGGDPRAWVAAPRNAVSFSSLQIAATDRGERTLLVEGHDPLELWELVTHGAPTVVVEVDPT